MSIKSRKKFIQGLTFSNAIVFSYVLKNNRDIFEEIASMFLGFDIELLEDVVVEETIQNGLKCKAVVLDSKGKDKVRRVINIEMQVEYISYLFKRARYYHAVLDHDTLQKGENYEDLPETYVIFINLFDPFGRNLPYYTMRSYAAEDRTILENNDSTTIYVNTTCTREDLSPSLRAFYDYVNKNVVSNDEFVRKLDKAVREAKETEKMWEHMNAAYEYVHRNDAVETVEKRLKEMEKEERAKGRAEAVRDNIKLMNSNGLNTSTIATALSMKEEDVIAILNKD